MRNLFSVLALMVILACLMSINALAQSDNKIEIGDSSYQPQTLTVPVGTTVTWVNGDTSEHTVTSDEGHFRSGYLASGEQFSYLFDSPGNYQFHCSIHPSVRGVIQVTSEPSGSYSALFASKRSSQDQKEEQKDSETAPASTDHITAPEKCEFCEMDSSGTANQYVKASQFASDRKPEEKAVPYSQYQTYAAQSEGNSLWIQGDNDWTKYAKVTKGSRLSLIAICSAEGKGYLHEMYPDGHKAKDPYYFYPYSQIGFYADTVGQHKLSFSAGDQESNSVVVDVTDGNVPSYPEQVYQQKSYQETSYNQKSYQGPGYQTKQAPAKDYTKDYDSFWKTSAVKMDDKGHLTYQGLQGKEYDLQPSSTNVMTRGVFYNDISYILVANPSGTQNTVLVNPQMGNWNMQNVQVLYGNLMAAQIKNLLQITAPAYQSGVIIIQPMQQQVVQPCGTQQCGAQPKGVQVQKKRYSFSVGPKPAYSFRAGTKPAYSATGGRKQPYSICAGPKPPYSFRVGY